MAKQLSVHLLSCGEAHVRFAASQKILPTRGVSVGRRVHQRKRQFERHLTTHGSYYQFHFHVVRHVNGEHVPILGRHANDSAGQRSFGFVHRGSQRILQSDPILCPRLDRMQHVLFFQGTPATGYGHVGAFLRGHRVLELTVAEHAHVHVLNDKYLQQ